MFQCRKRHLARINFIIGIREELGEVSMPQAALGAHQLETGWGQDGDLVVSMPQAALGAHQPG